MTVFQRMPAVVSTALLMTFALGLAPCLGDVILFTASTDNTGGANPVSVPGTNNPNIPTISAGVTVTPNPALLDGNITGPLNGISYGPFGFGANGGGNTGWVNISYTAVDSGLVRLVWEVAGADAKIGSALLTDNVRIDGNLQYGFESGLPAGSTALGTVGTSGALNVTDSSNNPLPPFNPTEGSKFAWLDISGGVTPIYDTVDPYTGSQLFSAAFQLNAGSTLTLDAAFLTNEGDPFHDYGIVTLQVVPEAPGLTLALIGMTVGAGCAGLTGWWTRKPKSQPLAS
jgi:hypothetical protein